MNFCINYGCGADSLERADQIRIEPKYFNLINTIADKYPNKTLVVVEPPENRWDDIKTYALGLRDQFVLEIRHIEYAYTCERLGIPYYYAFGATSFTEINWLIAHKATYIVVAPPMFFQLDKIKNKNIKVRVAPNYTHDGEVFSASLAHTSWILPAELHYYEDYIDTIFFVNCRSVSAEETFFDIYTRNDKWLAPLNTLFQGFPEDTFEAGFVEPMAPRRISCGQVCEIDGRCHFCDTALKVANSSVIMAYHQAAIDQT